MAEIVLLVDGLLEPNNHVIKAAEDKFNEFKKNPEWLVPALCAAVRDLQATQKHMAAVLLRKAVDDPDVFDNVQQARAGVLSGLLEFLTRLPPTDKMVRRSINSAVAALGARLVEADDEATAPDAWKKNEWPELLPTLYQMVQGGQEEQIVSALYVFTCMASGLNNQAGQILQMLSACFTHPTLAVKSEAVTCAFAFCKDLEAKNAAPFANLIGSVFAVLEQCIRENQTEKAQEVIEGLIEVMDEGQFLQASNHLPMIVNSMLQLAGSQACDEELRFLASEFLITVCETDSRAAKKVKGFIPSFIQLLLQWVRRVEEPDNEWATTQANHDDADGPTESDIGLEGLDRVACAIGGASMEKHVGQELFRLAKSEEWRERYAAMMSLYSIAEGCRDKFEPNLPQLTYLICGHLQDSHPKVRDAAGQAVSQFCTDFSDGFQRTFSAEILKAVETLLNDSVPRCRSQASNIVVNFCEDAVPELYKDKLEGLLGAYYQILTSNDQPLFVRQLSLSAISAISENQKKNFAPYYDRFMPIITSIFQLPEVKETNQLKGIAIECASFIASAVGPETFGAGNVGVDVMNYMMNIMKGMADDDVRAQYLFKSWGRLSEVVTPEAFAPYLKTLMPHFLKLITEKDEMSVVHVHDTGAKEAGTETVKITGTQRNFVIRSSVLEEKQMAGDIVYVFIKSQPTLMMEYLGQVSEAAKLLLGNMHREDIRSTASEIIYETFKIVGEKKMAQQAQELLKNILDDYLDALILEPDASTGALLLENLSLILKLLGDECVPAIETEIDDNGVMITHPHGFIFKAYQHLSKLFSDRLVEINKLQKDQVDVDGDEDEVVKVAEGLEAEENYLQQCGECIGHFLRTHKAFLEIFIKEFFPIISNEKFLTSKEFGTSGTTVALSILVDFLEYGKEHAMPYYHGIVSTFLTYGTATPDLAQSASYGLNVAAVYGVNIAYLANNPGLPKDFIEHSLQFLRGVCMRQADSDWQSAICNAVSALLTFLKHFAGQGGISEEAILPPVCTLLPVGGDHIEARVVHKAIFEYVRMQNPNVVGPNGSNMAQIKQLAALLMKEAMGDADEARINEETAAFLRTLL